MTAIDVPQPVRVEFGERGTDFVIYPHPDSRTAACTHCAFRRDARRGVPMWWVTHRCPEGSGRVVLWEVA